MKAGFVDLNQCRFLTYVNILGVGGTLSLLISIKLLIKEYSYGEHLEN